MFSWTGALDRSAYARRSSIVIAFLIGTIVLFPFLTRAIVMGSHCAIDTCGALGLVVSTELRPILFLIALLMALCVCVRRARDAGLRPWLGMFPPLMLVGDQAFLQYIGSSWAYAFSAGILRVNTPVYAAFGVVLMILLGVVRPGTLRSGGSSVLDRTILLLAAVLSISAVVRAIGLQLFVFTGLPPLVMLAVVGLFSYAAWTMPVFLSLVAYRLWRSNQAAPLPEPAEVAAGPNLWQPKRAALIGTAIAFAVMLWSLLANSHIPAPLALMALPVYFVPFFLPTAAIYAALVASLLRVRARRDAVAAAAALAALIPFGFWAGSLSSVLMAKARERAAIASIPKAALPDKVSAVVVEGEDWPSINCARERVLSGDYGLDDVLTRGQSKSQYLRFTRTTARSPVNKGVAADTGPSDYILIRFPRRPDFFQDRVSVDIRSPPAEIYAVDATGTRLVAASYVALNPAPSFPPMLTTSGWYRGDNSTTSEESCKYVGAFIQRELLDKLPVRKGGAI